LKLQTHCILNVEKVACGTIVLDERLKVHVDTVYTADGAP
jgi:hypothetical protein